MSTTRYAREGLQAFPGSRRGRYRRRRGPAAALRLLTLVIAGVALVGVWILVSSLLGSDPVPLQVVSSDGTPIAGATVANEGGRSATTGEDGETALAFDAPARLTAAAHGYRDATFEVDEIPRPGPLTLTMFPYVLQGRVVDQRGFGIVGAAVTIDGRTALSEEFGAYEITAVEPGPVLVSKAAWGSAEHTWDGDAARFDLVLEPFVAKGLRVDAGVAGSAEALEHLYAMIEGTVINTLVFDTKYEDGRVFHDIDVPLAHEAGAVTRTYDARAVIDQARSRGYYTITRIAAFQDNLMTRHRPEWAVLDSDGGREWRTDGGTFAWLDPTLRDVWRYSIDLGVAACRLGFDEIQFDYVRFPADGPTHRALYSIGAIAPEDAETRVATIAEFLETARREIHAEGCAVSADVFAITFSAVANPDQGIGQKVEELSWAVDVLSPMIYPSHYGRGWLGLDNPNEHPARVVGQALEAGIARLEGGALVRPWLQAFSWSATQVRESIAEAERRSPWGWMLWHSSSVYERGYFPTQ